jgi:hypothetical protein
MTCAKRSTSRNAFRFPGVGPRPVKRHSLQRNASEFTLQHVGFELPIEADGLHSVLRDLGCPPRKILEAPLTLWKLCSRRALRDTKSR